MKQRSFALLYDRDNGAWSSFLDPRSALRLKTENDSVNRETDEKMIHKLVKDSADLEDTNFMLSFTLCMFLFVPFDYLWTVSNLL